MAITATVYSNANASSRSVTFDFVGDVLAAKKPSANVSSNLYDYYFKITAGANTINGDPIPVKIVTKLDDLALNGQKQSSTNTANAYSDISEMVKDYIHDDIHGHVANQFSSGVSNQDPMLF